MLKVCISYLTKEQCEHKTKLFPDIKFSFNKNDIYTSDVAFGNPTIEEIEKSPNLKWIQTLSTGVNCYTGSTFPKNIMLTSATGAYGISIAEHIMAMQLTLTKRLINFYNNQKHGIWQDLGELKNIKNSTVLIIGLGDIGTAYAKLVKAFGATVIGVKRNITNKPDYVDEICSSSNIETVLPRADTIVICTPLTAQTKDMINEKTISLMKSGVIVINIARGQIINTEALCHALDTGKISAVGLDVTHPEPLPKNHKLWSYDNVIITPHISGNFNSNVTKSTIIDIIFDNLMRYINGEQLINIKNDDIMDKK